MTRERWKVKCDDCGAEFTEVYPDGLNGNAHSSHSDPHDPKPCECDSQYTLLGRVAEKPDDSEPCECAGEPVPGAGWPFNDQAEVERCDMCEKFDDDISAGIAVVDKLNEVLGDGLGDDPDADAPKFALVVVAMPRSRGGRVTPLLAKRHKTSETVYRIMPADECEKLWRELKEKM